MDKNYKLEIPRNQFDRIADAFEAMPIIVNGYDIKKDTVIFTISEQQRKKFAKCAIKKDNPKIQPRLRAAYWITQMFLPRNINQYKAR
jgi:hypothetical protein